MVVETGGYSPASLPRSSISRCVNTLGIRPDRPETIPFAYRDSTVGTEFELQVAVKGARSDVDLAISIEKSRYYGNVVRRAAAGDTSGRVISELEKWLEQNTEGIWENSWVRFPERLISRQAQLLMDTDLLADKRNPSLGYRSDRSRFQFTQQGESYVRIPISYLVRLSLADVLSLKKLQHSAAEYTGRRLLNCFLNDNTSPETSSFHICHLRPENGNGKAIAREAAKRHLLTHLLVEYANQKFQLRQNGQEAVIFLSPNPPRRQKDLNGCVADSFYRELFMSPCISWDKGEEKRDYMILCHQVLSRSHLNAVDKLREAGIINSNLVVLPNTSNISLANNGVHISLGSLRMTNALKDSSSPVTSASEKYIADLVVKIVEHFLPIFVGSYSAAPYRLDFWDFHPERALGFLPHELDYTHLRMLWRRWRRKARNGFLGRSLTPFGPHWLDEALALLLRLRGDFVSDFRLLDYPVALMSTRNSPALDGKLGNAERLKEDLEEMGAFDQRMSLYLLYKSREFQNAGYSGFEGRYYSLFESFEQDMARATDLQVLVTALAFQYITSGRWTHSDIPDQPFVESERRQIFFGTAIGVPTSYVSSRSPNRFLLRIVERTKGVRQSHRYPGYLRVKNSEYRKALVRMILEDGKDLVEMLEVRSSVTDLKARLNEPETYSVAAKLTRAILDKAGVRSPFSLSGREFNLTAEDYYRQELHKRHLEEGIACLENQVEEIDSSPNFRRGLHRVLGGKSAEKFLRSSKKSLSDGTASVDQIVAAIAILLTAEMLDTGHYEESAYMTWEWAS